MYRHTCGVRVSHVTSAFAHLLVCPHENPPRHPGDCTFCDNEGTTLGCFSCGRWRMPDGATLRKLA